MSHILYENNLVEAFKEAVLLRREALQKGRSLSVTEVCYILRPFCHILKTYFYRIKSTLSNLVLSVIEGYQKRVGSLRDYCKQNLQFHRFSSFPKNSSLTEARKISSGILPWKIL